MATKRVLTEAEKKAYADAMAERDAGRAQKAKRAADQATYSAANKTRLEATAKQKAAADAVRKERLANPKSFESRMAKAQADADLRNPAAGALRKKLSGMSKFGSNSYDPSSGKTNVNVNTDPRFRKKPLTSAEQAYVDQRKATRAVLNKTPENQTYMQRPKAGVSPTPTPAPKPAMGMKKGGMAKSKPSGIPGLNEYRKFAANPANKAEVAKRSEMAGKMMSGMAAKQSANSDKVQAMKAQADAAKTRQAASAAKAKQAASAPKPKPKPVMPARSVGLGAAVRSGAPALKFGTSGGMGARPMGGMGSMGARAGMTRPAMTPQVKQGLQGMSDKLRAMPMKKGGKAGKK